MTNYDNCLKEIKKIKLCWSEKGVRQTAYSIERSEEENNKFKLENFTMYDLIFKYICNPKYKKDCEYRAKNRQAWLINKNGKDYTFKLKDGVIGVWSFRDFRYKSSENFESYNKWLGSQLFDIDFELKKINKETNKEEGYYTWEEANEYSRRIIPLLYKKLCKYEWFVFIDVSTSGKGIHIYTHSIPYDVDLIKDDKGNWTYNMELGIQDHITRKRNQYKSNYHHKLKYIFDEIEPIWKELGIEQDLIISVDDAMYKPEQPMNITPLHEGNLLINPNFKCNYFDEIYNDTYNGIVFEDIDERVVKNLELVKEEEEHEEEIIKKLKTHIKVDNKVYNINGGAGFYFGHGKQHIQIIGGKEVKVPKIESVIMTLKIFYSDEEQLKIWKTPGFYYNDWEGLNIEYWIKNFKIINKKTNKELPQDEWIPNKYVINFLNKYCGFDIQYREYTQEEKYEHSIIYNLKQNEYLSDYWDKILAEINNENGIYLVISPTGSGKTKTHTDINDKVRENLMMNMVFQTYVNQPVLCTEPYNSILNSKFKRDCTEIITGSKHFDNGLNKGTLYVTNYIHFVTDLSIEDYKLFKYIIIDESHLITKEEFRSEQLVDFIHKLSEASKYCTIILQTATPMDETKIFPMMKNIFKLNKKDKRYIKYNYLEYIGSKKFSLDHIYSLVRNNIDKGIKTYVYQNNISIDKAKAYANLFHDINVCIYHKRLKLTGEDEKYGMKQLEETHLLDATHYNKKDKQNHKDDELNFKDVDNNKYKNYSLLISSVYFGVGNDIDDDIDEACCIIIGNKTWQEDVQVYGRWRNAKKINVYEIIGNLNGGKINTRLVDYNKMLRYKIKNIKYNYNDITNRQNSIVVRDQVYKIENEKDIPFWACISICEDYHSNKNEKDKHLINYVDEYDPNIEVLEYSTETIEESKKFFKSLSDERLNIKKEIISKLMTNNEKDIKYTHIPKLDKWTKIIKRLYYNIGKQEFELLLNHICSYQMMHNIDVFNNILSNYLNDRLDYSEIAAFEYYRKFEDMKHSFLIWYFCQDINEENDYMILGNWYSKFRWKAKCYSGLPNSLIAYLFSDVKIQLHKQQLQVIETTSDFFGINLQEEINKINNQVIEMYEPNGKIKKFKKTNKTVDEIINMIDKYEMNTSKINGQKGGKNGKSIIITENIKNSRTDLLSKYNIQIGQVFTSCTELAEYCHKDKNTITQWINKGWVSIYLDTSTT